MERSELTLAEFFPEVPAWDLHDKPFEPHAAYNSSLDCVIYLKEDVSYSADRVDHFLTVLWHPEGDRAVGVKLKGCKFLFGRVAAIAAAARIQIPTNAFLPLISAIEVALTVRAGAALTDIAAQERLAEQQEVTAAYEQAASIVGQAYIDATELTAAA